MGDTFLDIKKKLWGLELYESLIMLGIGLAVLLFGYRIKKTAFFIIWFLIGYYITLYLMPTINGWIPQIADMQLYQILLPICGGLLLALLGFSIEKLCVAGICFFLVMLVTINYFGTSIPVLAVGAIIGAVAAASATALIKPAVIIATSLAGSYAITVSLLSLIPAIDGNIFYFPMVIGIAILGAIFQFSSTKHMD